MSIAAQTTDVTSSGVNKHWLTNTKVLSQIILWTILICSSLFSYHSIKLGIEGLAIDTMAEDAPLIWAAAETRLQNTAWAMHMISLGMANSLGPILVLVGMTAIKTQQNSWLRVCHRIVATWTVLFACFGSVVGSYFLLFALGVDGNPEARAPRAKGHDTMFYLALYGPAFFITGVGASYYAIKKNWVKHKEWAIRFMIMCVSSWFFRIVIVDYVIITGYDNFLGSPVRAVGLANFFITPLACYQLYLEKKRRGALKNINPWVNTSITALGVAIIGLGTVAMAIR